jgi:hypothetical protein
MGRPLLDSHFNVQTKTRQRAQTKIRGLAMHKQEMVEMIVRYEYSYWTGPLMYSMRVRASQLIQKPKDELEHRYTRALNYKKEYGV